MIINEKSSLPVKSEPGQLGNPISDESSEDEQSQIRALEEDQVSKMVTIIF